ncbi:Uncharacterised protein [Amycolatopsis camponoti]|uniref:Uncharacterized protein n=1 Tax=Amycolatopsis camponoti TaxID=2606593 RepID=A0A6I8LYT7_9PSEU|nr:Uncharacterised protein [Amycolatopsis camponoti]
MPSVWDRLSVPEKVVVALEKDFRPGFDPNVNNAVVHNGAHAPSVTAYLTDRLTGAAIAGGSHAR